MKKQNTPQKTINKRQEQFNNIIISLLIKCSKVNQLLSQLLDANNHGENYLFDDYDIITDNQFKVIQDTLIANIDILSKQNIKLFEYVTRKDKHGK